MIGTSSTDYLSRDFPEKHAFVKTTQGFSHDSEEDMSDLPTFCEKSYRQQSGLKSFSGASMVKPASGPSAAAEATTSPQTVKPKALTLSVTPDRSQKLPQQQHNPMTLSVTRDPRVQLQQSTSMTLPVTKSSFSPSHSRTPMTLAVTQAPRNQEEQQPPKRRATGLPDFSQEIPYPFAAQFKQMFPSSFDGILNNPDLRWRPPSPDPPPPPPSTPPLEGINNAEAEWEAVSGLLKLNLPNATKTTKKQSSTPLTTGAVPIEVDSSRLFPLPKVDEKFLFPDLKDDSLIDLENVVFDPLYYYDSYSIVRQECGWNKDKLFYHWKSKGIDNGLKCSPVLDLAFFITKIPAMYQTRQLSFRVAYDFFLRHINDRIPSSKDYDPKAYVEHYPQLKRYTAKQLILHYMQVGRFHHLIAE